ncbi:hypothetical protein HanRHA438_Chr09g0429561 [Helianthus annuus]|nr:hypothetical protein HanRHA438_Chr09g0429561 [Helianthus annuus]
MGCYDALMHANDSFHLIASSVDANFNATLRSMKFVFDPGPIVVNRIYFPRVIKLCAPIGSSFESRILGSTPVDITQIVQNSTSHAQGLWAYMYARAVKGNHFPSRGSATLIVSPNSYFGGEWP